MENKEIYIDGVDVSGCPFFEDERKLLNPAGQELNFKNICSLSFYNFTDFDKDFLCNQSPNCYYKQLKHKEQECEAYKMEAEEGKEINAELKAENEQLKNFHINLVGVKECEIRELAELEAENRSLKAYIKILENNNEVNECEKQ